MVSFVTSLLFSLASLQSERAIEVRVDPRVELLTATARLAGFREFNMPNSASGYSASVEEHFGKLRDHAAISKLQKLRAEHGVSYDAIASLAMHLGELPELSERIPFERAPERLDRRWGGIESRDFLADLRDFAQQSRASEFFAAQRPFYEKVEARLRERLGRSKALPWFDAFFGARATASYVAIPGLLCGGGNYGAGVRFDDGRPEEITPVLGCWTWDDEGLPVFGEGYLPLLVHELCHSYTNAFVDRFESELAAAGAKIHASCAAKMSRQGYGNWKTVIYESLVRASVVSCRRATEGDAAADEQIREETKNHFAWVPELSKLLDEHAGREDPAAGFETFMPRVVRFFDEYAAKMPAPKDDAPRLVSIEPRDGASDVDPGLANLVITFDRSMRDQSWSIVGSAADCPKINGTPKYDAARKVLTVPVVLEPARTYRFGLNSTRNQGFVSKDGVPLEPVELTFTTRAK